MLENEGCSSRWMNLSGYLIHTAGALVGRLVLFEPSIAACINAKWQQAEGQSDLRPGSRICMVQERQEGVEVLMLLLDPTAWLIGSGSHWKLERHLLAFTSNSGNHAAGLESNDIRESNECRQLKQSQATDDCNSAALKASKLRIHETRRSSASLRM
jgi:hypothetical protein